jgi:hypothetical protein
MSTPSGVPLWKTSASPDHLLSEQIDQQQGRVALRTVPAQAHGMAKELAVRAARLTEVAFTATRALVQGVHHHCATSLELLAEVLQVGRARSVTQAEGLLLVGSRAIARAP